MARTRNSLNHSALLPIYNIMVAKNLALSLSRGAYWRQCELLKCDCVLRAPMSLNMRDNSVLERPGIKDLLVKHKG